ncbi:MAG TPA: ABC transporter substrate-binding protein [Methylomirabilota bacterium]|jgi:phospholipid transport system substrate-binding protein|nr:ABC transporter substrate-binding protein [Methylomirabilota bacterium]
MNTQARPLTVALVLSLVLALVSPVFAGAPTEALKERVDLVVKSLAEQAPNTEERRARIRKIADSIFDYPDTARRALGPHWNSRSPKEREEFVKLFGDLLDRAYMSKIELYQGERVQYTAEQIDGNEATVKTVIATKKGSEVPVDYRMHLKDGRWLVYDVIIEGVSLVSNYRTQFNKIVQTEGYDKLVQRLRSKDTAPDPAASPGRSRTDR